MGSMETTEITGPDMLLEEATAAASASAGAAAASSEVRFQSEPKRWCILVAFMVANLNQCLCNMTFSSLAPAAMKDYFGAGMTKETTDLLLNWGPLFGAAFFWPAMAVSSRPGGLRQAIWWGVVVMLAANVVRSVPVLIREWSGEPSSTSSAWAYCCYHLGQILVAVAGPFLMGSVTLLSVTWFPECERTTATALAQLSNGMGATVAYLTPLWLVPSPEKMANMFYFDLALALVPAGLLCCYFPAKPVRFPSAAAAAHHEHLETRIHEGSLSGDQCRTCFRLPRLSLSFLLLILSIGTVSGFMVAWSSLFQTTLEATELSESFVGWTGFGNALACNLSGLVAGRFIDKWYRHRLKTSILVGFTGLLLCVVWLTFSMPSAAGAKPSSSSSSFSSSPSSQSFLPFSKAAMAVVMALAGAFQGIADPLAYELAAEILWPAKESTSAGLMLLVVNVACSLSVILDAIFEPEAGGKGGGCLVLNYLVAGALLLAIMALSVGVREMHQRPQDDAAASVRLVSER